MKKALLFLLALCLLLSLGSCSEPRIAPTMDSLDLSPITSGGWKESATITDHVKLTVIYTAANGQWKTGSIVVRLFEEVAPVTVKNFQTLVSNGYYDNTIFHRIISGALIQGGANTTADADPIRGEFTSNGFENNLSHVRGVISMARADDPNSASAQFFIMQGNGTKLDGDYAAFGIVVDGMDTVDGIASTPVSTNPYTGEASLPTGTVLLSSAVFVTYDPTAQPEANGPSNTEPAPTMDELDFSAVSLDDCVETTEITNLVRMRFSYADANGQAKTGDVVIRLFENVAPITVQNFQELVASGYYNGLSCHRVVKNFMIQGGAGSTVPSIYGEFSSNGFENNLSHLRGVISMARSAYPNTANSQFFIMHADNAKLNGNYASFGYVVYGMDTIDDIANTPVVANPYMNGEISAPTSPITIVSAVFVTL